MTSLEINVRGVARQRFSPERASVTVTVAVTGPDRESVYSQATTTQQPLLDSIKVLEMDGAVTSWRSDSIRVYSHRPYDDEGRQRDPVYSTRISVGAEFIDFEKLSEFIDQWSLVDGIEVGGVSWDVAEENRRGYEADVRRAAVDDAVAKAEAYADAVGRGPVTPTQLADPDMLRDQPNPGMARMVMAAPDGGAPSVELRAEDIVIRVAVDARFVAE